MNNDLKICKYCKEQINKEATRCPKCGGKLSTPTWVIVLITISITLGLALVYIFVSPLISKQKIENTYKDINKKTSFSINETFQNKYEKVIMKEINTDFNDYSSFLKPTYGNKYIMVQFEIENINKEGQDLFVSEINYIAYADDVIAPSILIGNEKYKTLSTTLKSGEKTNGYIVYEVPINSNKIKINHITDPEENNVVEFKVK